MYVPGLTKQPAAVFQIHPGSEPRSASRSPAGWAGVPRCSDQQFAVRLARPCPSPFPLPSSWLGFSSNGAVVIAALLYAPPVHGFVVRPHPKPSAVVQNPVIIDVRITNVAQTVPVQVLLTRVGVERAVVAGDRRRRVTVSLFSWSRIGDRLRQLSKARPAPRPHPGRCRKTAQSVQRVDLHPSPPAAAGSTGWRSGPRLNDARSPPR